MATLTDVRDGLVEALSNGLPGVNVYRTPSDDITAPAVIIAGFTIDPATFGAGGLVGVDLYAAVSRRNEAEIDTLDALVTPDGDSSAWAAINADPSLGDRVSYCVVTNVGDYREIVIGETGYYSATLRLEVGI